MEVELDSLVIEYLEARGFHQACAALRQETKEGPPTPSSLTHTSGLQYEFLVAFNSGERSAFFGLWSKHLPTELLASDPLCIELEVLVSVYFALYPSRTGLGSLARSMADFRSHLEARGRVLAQSQEFSAFCALPYIPDPALHPTFKPILTDAWVSELRTRLAQFLRSVLVASPQSPPQLLALYQAVMSPPSPSKRMLGAVPPSACELSERRVSCGMVGGGQEVLGWGRQLAATEERLLELQSHYHSLVDISMELIEALESAVSGRMITADYVHHLCSRLLGGAAESEGSDVKASVMRASVTALRESLQVAPAIPSRADSNLLALDFTKVKNHLACSSDMCKALLLQALRWRLTRSLTGSQRLGVLSSYVQNDILGLASDAEGGEHRQVTLALMTSEHPQLREQMARLLNSLSSLSGGRSYLSKCSALVQVLCQVLVLEKSDSLARRNALGAVQKLSLRHHLQTLMIEAGLIRWVVDVLGEPDLLCDYSLRYSLALLMNLCLRSAGRNSCIPFGCAVLKALCSLLEHADHEICSYVNGSLYSLLSLPCLREEAKRMGFDRLFSSALQSSPVDIKSQIKYLLEMLSSDKDAESSESGEEAEEDDEEEDPELIEGDEDEADVEGGDGQVSGETLLVQYLMSNGSTHSSYQTSSTVNKTLELPAFYTRPTTPQSFSIRPLTAVYSRPMSIGPTLCVAKRPVSSAT